MRLLLPSVALILAASAAAQTHSSSSNTYSSLGGWGSVAFPGTGHPPSGGYTGVHPPVTGPYNAARAGQFSGGPRYEQRRRPTAVFAYPVYIGGYSEPQYAPEQQPVQAAPTVIINQNFAAPLAPPVEPQPPVETMHTYSGTRSQPAAATDAQYYLIALKDHTIYSALAYWVENGTLHYVTSPNMHNQTSLDLIDDALTIRLNEDRGVPVTLAPAH